MQKAIKRLITGLVSKIKEDIEKDPSLMRNKKKIQDKVKWTGFSYKRINRKGREKKIKYVLTDGENTFIIKEL